MKINKRDLFYIIISICALVRMGLYGFAFYPILDDWVQYGTFSLEPNPIRDKFIATGYWTYRPLSWLLDIFLWCRISFLLPLIITLMHAGSCILFLRAGEKIGFKLGIPFILIYMFIPMNSEATMWMSACTRIIVPLFFLSLSLNFAIKLAEFVGAPTGRPRRKVRKFSDGQWPPLRVTYSILFFITQLFALFIYEQVAVITAVITFLLGLKLKRKTIWITTLVTSILLGAYYLAFMPAGPAIERAAVAGNQFWDFYYAFCEGLGRVSWEIFANGFARGIKVLMANPFYFILVALSSLAFGLFSVFKNDDDVKPKKRRGRPRKFSRAKLLFDKHKMPIAKILLGIVLFILTLLPFIFIKGNSLALRSLFVAIIGFAVMVDGIVDLIPKRQLFMPAISGALVFMFMISGISELTDYRACSLLDREYALGLAPQAMQEHLYIERIPTLLTEQNSFYVEHICSVSSVNFAITGAIRYLTKNLATPTVKVVWDKDLWENKYAPK